MCIRDRVRGDLPVEGRFGHSACIYKREMIIFGGERRYNATIKQRECLSDVRALNVETFEWRSCRASGEVIESRRNHVAFVIGRHMIVHGGFNCHGRPLTDMWSLDLGEFILLLLIETHAFLKKRQDGPN
eukprot:TRINITY_DN2675_c0_g2_i1.p1 TRINITY_DN2675_c0_g2~~TRINITY_DN2675_c0_g2_i1.p1  ORF type:complete len:130 (-),score=13.57 TRINITY_DN2675_c0_g2_i1:151-540(-)